MMPPEKVEMAEKVMWPENSARVQRVCSVCAACALW
jgi:hypothetical protein